MELINNVEELEAIYGTPPAASLRKVAHTLTPAYRAWIGRARFCILSTVGPDGTDATPRGDDGPVVAEIDESTLALPDWRGNNRMDSLRNIVCDPRVSLMFMVAGSNNAVRVNGTGRVTVDGEMKARFEKQGQVPRSVVLITIREVYFQCGRALVRSGLWRMGDQSEGLPSAGQILADMTDGSVGGADYDAGWSARAAKTLW